MTEEDWYWRGRVACGVNQPRELPDTRVKSANRLAFYKGWDVEAALRAVRSEQEVQRSRELFARLKEHVANL